MAADDMYERILEPEVAMSAAAVVVVLSPPVRQILRRSIVYGLSGLIMASDAVARLAHRVDIGIQPASDDGFVHVLTAEARRERVHRGQVEAGEDN
jgi:hypothetical protein